MSPDQAQNERVKLAKDVRFHRIATFGLLLALFGSIALNGYMVLKDPVKLVPPVIKRPYEIGSSITNADYLVDLSDYVVSTIYTVTPETVDHNVKTILKIAHPDGYANLKSELNVAAARIKKERISTIWVGRDEDVQPRAGVVTARGKLKVYIADKLVSEKDKTVRVRFETTISGRTYVADVKEIERGGSANNVVN